MSDNLGVTNKTVIALPDTHFPWHSQKIKKVYDIISDVRPDLVIQLGDLYDNFSFSRFSKTLNLMTPAEELVEAREGAENMWKNIRKAAGKNTRMIQLMGNHCARIEKRILDKFPEIESLVDVHKIYRFPNVETQNSDREEFNYQGVKYVHGWLGQLGAHARYFDCSVVHGHSHRSGIIFYPRKSGSIWELDCGFLADETARPMQYSSTMTTRWNLGIGIIDKLGPRFVPL